MSGRCQGWALKHGPKPEDLDRQGQPYGLARARALRAVLYTIADAANVEGEHAHPGLAAMVEGSLYSRRRVQELAADLVAEGWVSVEEEGGGRGRARVYAVNMARRNDASAAPIVERVQPAPETVQSEAGKGAGSEPKGAAAMPDPSPNGVHNGVATGLSTVPAPGGAGSVPANSVSIGNLCNMLATSIDLHGRAGRPRITKAWERDMRLLIERGELGVEGARGRSPDLIARAISFVFTELAERGADGFCWADQVRSPGALRRHWPRLVEARHKLDRARGPSKGAQTIDRVAERLMREAGEEPQQRGPLRLLPGAEHGG